MGVCALGDDGFFEKAVLRGSKFGFEKFNDAKCTSFKKFQSFPVGISGACQQVPPGSEEYEFGVRSYIPGALSSVQALINKYKGHQIAISTTYTSNTCKVATGFHFIFYDGCMVSTNDDNQPTGDYMKYKFTNSGLAVSFFSTPTCTDTNPRQHEIEYSDMGFNKCEKSDDSDDYEIVTSIFSFTPTSKPTSAPTYLKGKPTPRPTRTPTVEIFEYIEADYYKGPDCKGPLYSATILSTGKCLPQVNETSHNATGRSFKYSLLDNKPYKEEYSDKACKKFLQKSQFLPVVAKQCISFSDTNPLSPKSMLVTGLHSVQNVLKMYNTSIINVGYAGPGCKSNDESEYNIYLDGNSCQITDLGKGVKQKCDNHQIRVESYDDATCNSEPSFVYSYNASCSDIAYDGKMSSKSLCV